MIFAFYLIRISVNILLFHHFALSTLVYKKNKKIPTFILHLANIDQPWQVRYQTKSYNPGKVEDINK